MKKNDIVQRFYNDSYMRDGVKDYILDIIDKRVLKDTYSEKETKHLAKAREFIKEVFATMRVEFDKKIKKEDIDYTI